MLIASLYLHFRNGLANVMVISKGGLTLMLSCIIERHVLLIISFSSNSLLTYLFLFVPCYVCQQVHLCIHSSGVVVW